MLLAFHVLFAIGFHFHGSHLLVDLDRDLVLKPPKALLAVGQEMSLKSCQSSVTRPLKFSDSRPLITELVFIFLESVYQYLVEAFQLLSRSFVLFVRTRELLIHERHFLVISDIALLERNIKILLNGPDLSMMHKLKVGYLILQFARPLILRHLEFIETLITF